MPKANTIKVQKEDLTLSTITQTCALAARISAFQPFHTSFGPDTWRFHAILCCFPFKNGT